MVVPLVKPVRVYPRVCGGTSITRNRRTLFIGLSPRVRGNHFNEDGIAAKAGSIPACAGEPRVSWMPTVMRRVYPRVCGGTLP